MVNIERKGLIKYIFFIIVLRVMYGLPQAAYLHTEQGSAEDQGLMKQQIHPYQPQIQAGSHFG